jgi:hypothetical protein
VSELARKARPNPPGPFRERRAFNEARRGEAMQRDAARHALADEVSAHPGPTIPPEAGLLVVPPGEIAAADPVVAAGNALLDAAGHDELVARASKGGFIAQDILPESALELDSPYLRFALSDDVVRAVTRYLGLVPILTSIEVWYSLYNARAPKSSQLWHLDIADTTQVKVWIHLNDVGPDSGPLTALDATASDTLGDRIGYDFKEGYRVPDEQVDELAGDELVRFEGPAGTVDFIDTSRCFHFGSRVEASATPRRLYVAQFLTPYAFKFTDHRDEAPFRHLASAGSSELETLLLGAA